MRRFNLCFFVVLLSLLLTSCQTTRVDEPPRPRQLAMVSLHDMDPTMVAPADGQCTQIEFDVEMKTDPKDLEDDLRLDESSTSALLNFIERKARTLNALVCTFDSPPDDEQIQRIIHRPVAQGAKKKGDWIMICSPAPGGGEDCTICVEDKKGKLRCVEINFPPRRARLTPPMAK